MARQSLQGELSLLRGLKNGNPLILSVDDEAGILFTRHKLLQNAGYDVLSAADGEQALHLFAAYPVNLVLLDFAMPRMDGGVVAQEIKRLNGKIPVIMVSASPLPDDILTCADLCITKGQGPALLLEKIGQFLSSPSTLPSLQRASATNGNGARRRKTADAGAEVDPISRHGIAKPEAKF